MECRRLVAERVERFREDRVLEKFWEAEGRSREDTDVGKEGSTAIALCAPEIVSYRSQMSKSNCDCCSKPILLETKVPRTVKITSSVLFKTR